MMFDDKTYAEVLRSLEGEIAKTLSELRCARDDVIQAESRMKFCLATIHYLKQRDNESRD